MSRLLCMVAVLIAVVGVAQALPLRTVSEREALLRDLLRLINWLSSTPIPGAFPQGRRRPLITSDLICGVVQSSFPRSETVKTKRDLTVNMIYHLCLPLVGPNDIDFIRLILSVLADDGPGNTQDDAPGDAPGNTQDDAPEDAPGDGTVEDARAIGKTSKQKENTF